MKMEEKRFFKVMMPGFHEKLNLPQAFCRNLTQETPERAIFKTHLGQWGIRACRNQAGLICFENGWPDFVHHHGLSVGDLVVFEGTETFQFNAVVFDINGCEKRLPFQEPAKRKLGKRVAHDTKNPSLTIKMMPYHGLRRSNVAIPRWFLRANNIGDNAILVLKDRHGREWKTKTKVELSGYYKMAGRGWHDFYKANHLKLGDVCVFDLTSITRDTSNKKCSVVLDAHIFRASYV